MPERGRREALEAIRPVDEQASAPATLAAVCKIHETAEDWDGVIRLTAGLLNEDVGALLEGLTRSGGQSAPSGT